MDTLLIAGLDSIVGVNLAAHFAGRFQVVGVSRSVPVSVAGCHTGVCPVQHANDVREWVESVRPDRLIYCGPGAHSTWDPTVTSRPSGGDVESAGHWAAAAREYGAELTVISSDAVFTGPWVFHDEDSNCLCDSAPARALRRVEKTCAQLCPETLVVRTNVVGWSYAHGWIEQLVDDLENETAGPFDYQRHATPILATDLADILESVWQAGLSGVYHIAGAERINPNRFAHRLAQEFGLPKPMPVDGNRLTERPTGFGCGESSLHTTQIRKALGVAMPTISDCLLRLRDQKQNGYSESLKNSGVLEKVA